MKVSALFEEYGPKAEMANEKEKQQMSEREKEQILQMRKNVLKYDSDIQQIRKRLTNPSLTKSQRVDLRKEIDTYSQSKKRNQELIKQLRDRIKSRQ